MNRICIPSDLRVHLDITPKNRVAKDGAPLRRDLETLTATLLHDWRGPDLEWYYCCSNRPEVRGHPQSSHARLAARASIAPLRSSILTLRRRNRTLRLPAQAAHRGRVSDAERRFVREHLGEVNTRLAADGEHLIDPCNRRMWQGTDWTRPVQMTRRSSPRSEHLIVRSPSSFRQVTTHTQIQGDTR